MPSYRVPEDKTAKNRLHTDIRVAGEGPWDMAERERLIRATLPELDPEGNEFCAAQLRVGSVACRLTATSDVGPAQPWSEPRRGCRHVRRSRVLCSYRGGVTASWSSPAARWGAVALVIRPAYIATEVITAAATTGGYDFVSDSVSKLGEVGCSAAYCSPRHELMNGSFVGFGVLLAGGALLLARPFGPWATGLLVISGVSSVATGLAPLDQDATLHAIAATPLFVAQPLALAALGIRARENRPALARALFVTAAVTAAAAVGFVVSGEDSSAAGALERLALWPVLFGVGAAAWACRSRSTR